MFWQTFLNIEITEIGWSCGSTSTVYISFQIMLLLYRIHSVLCTYRHVGAAWALQCDVEVWPLCPHRQKYQVSVGCKWVQSSKYLGTACVALKMQATRDEGDPRWRRRNLALPFIVRVFSASAPGMHICTIAVLCWYLQRRAKVSR